jgi:hypothetical protein
MSQYACMMKPSKVGCSLERITEEVDCCVDTFNRGCFDWMRSSGSGRQSEVPASLAFFCCAADEISEIQMAVAPRDVHCQTRNGIAEWVLNQKPKKMRRSASNG